MRPVIAVLRHVTVSQQVHRHSARNTAVRVPSVTVVVSVRFACPLKSHEHVMVESCIGSSFFVEHDIDSQFFFLLAFFG